MDMHQSFGNLNENYSRDVYPRNHSETLGFTVQNDNLHKLDYLNTEVNHFSENMFYPGTANGQPNSPPFQTNDRRYPSAPQETPINHNLNGYPLAYKQSPQNVNLPSFPQSTPQSKNVNGHPSISKTTPAPQNVNGSPSFSQDTPPPQNVNGRPSLSLATATPQNVNGNPSFSQDGAQPQNQTTFPNPQNMEPLLDTVSLLNGNGPLNEKSKFRQDLQMSSVVPDQGHMQLSNCYGSQVITFWKNPLSETFYEMSEQYSEGSQFSQRTDYSYDDSPDVSMNPHLSCRDRSSRKPKLHARDSENIPLKTEGMNNDNVSLSDECKNTNIQPQRSCCELIMKSLAMVISLATIIISTYLLIILCNETNDPKTELQSPPSLLRETIILPCDDLLNVFPTVALHPCKDKVISDRFRDVGIQKHEEINGTTYCELPISSVMDRLAQTDSSHSDARVKLQPKKDLGPPLEYSNYNLSVVDVVGNDLMTDCSSIVIEKDGLYFVYLSITLAYGSENNNPTCHNLKYKTSVTHLLRHRVHPETHKQYTALLRSEHTCCETCNVEMSSDFTGGLFNLTKNDKLFIQVSAPNIVSTNGTNYLGFFQVPGSV